MSNRLVLVLMIKNEEKIIERCINSVLPICDAICITDTGSTDGTIVIVNKIFSQLDIPSKLYQNDWINFGISRTTSYNNAVDFINGLKWDGNNTYALLLDADMTLNIRPSFDINTFSHNGYCVIQENNVIKYQNVRLIKLNGTWKCVGPTHEYWSGEDVQFTDTLHILDIGDGGSKTDKLPRDERLLLGGIKEDPLNGRYHFYLAQTYKDMGKPDMAIKYYEKRIEIGGWAEEIYYSYYQIANCYKDKGNTFEALVWGQRAHNYRPGRCEAILFLSKLYREKGDNLLSLHYSTLGLKLLTEKSKNSTDDILFVEKMDGKFEYEQSISNYYAHPNDKLTGLIKIVKYLNMPENIIINSELVRQNMYFYIERLANYGHIEPFAVPKMKYDDMTFNPSSTSLIRREDGNFIANVRYVNYILNDRLLYEYPNGTIVTINAIVVYDKNLKTILAGPSVLTNLQCSDPKSNIHGLEDIRIYKSSKTETNLDNNKIYYTATSKQFTPMNRIHVGEYDIISMKYQNDQIIEPPTNTNCEKNWIPIKYENQNLFIYKWHPLQIGIINEKGNKLNIIKEISTPRFFQNLRGSTSPEYYNGSCYLLTHGVKYEPETRRKYYHCLIVLNPETLEVQKYTAPFYFNDFNIEYTLGMAIIDDQMKIIFSYRDRDPKILRIDMNCFNKMYINA